MDMLTAFVFFIMIILMLIVGAVTVLLSAIQNFPIISAIVIATVICYFIKRK